MRDHGKTSSRPGEVQQVLQPEPDKEDLFPVWRAAHVLSLCNQLYFSYFVLFMNHN